jgi:hypothetical protein
MLKTCKDCSNFLGGGDWNLCCKNPPEDLVGWCGFLCYEDTEACKNFNEKDKLENFVERLHTELRHYGPKDTFNKGFFLTLANRIMNEMKEN